MASSNMRNAVTTLGSRPQDPCTRRMMFGALRPIGYRPTLIDRLLSHWNRLY